MSERLVVDSIMTADGEVVPLGPVDKDGHRGNPVCAYLAARGLCRGHMDEEGKCKFSDASFCANGMVSNIRPHQASLRG